jgi:hypothetical protein
MSWEECKILWVDENTTRGWGCFSNILQADIVIELDGNKFHVAKNRWGMGKRDIPLDFLDLYLERTEKELEKL